MKWKAIGIATLFVTLATSSFGQGRFGERGGFGRPTELPGAEQKERGGRPDRLVGLQEVLGLNEAQVEAIRAATEAHQETQQLLNEQTRAAGQALRTLIEQGTDPTAIGNATLALEDLRNQSKALRDQLQTTIRNTLTIGQQELFDALQALRGGRGNSATDGRRGGRGARGPRGPGGQG